MRILSRKLSAFPRLKFRKTSRRAIDEFLDNVYQSISFVLEDMKNVTDFDFFHIKRNPIGSLKRYLDNFHKFGGDMNHWNGLNILAGVFIKHIIILRNRGCFFTLRDNDSLYDLINKIMKEKPKKRFFRDYSYRILSLFKGIDFQKEIAIFAIMSDKLMEYHHPTVKLSPYPDTTILYPMRSTNYSNILKNFLYKHLLVRQWYKKIAVLQNIKEALSSNNLKYYVRITNRVKPRELDMRRYLLEKYDAEYEYILGFIRRRTGNETACNDYIYILNLLLNDVGFLSRYKYKKSNHSFYKLVYNPNLKTLDNDFTIVKEVE